MANRIRESLLGLLLERSGSFVSGEEISRHVNCSRTAIWKHIEELRKEGYQIEARPRSGYRLLYRPDRVAPEELKPHLTTRRFGQAIRYWRQIPSTQPAAHEWAREGAEEGALVITEEQTQGRGRLGRMWHSPPNNGIWMSIILRPPIPLTQAPQLTLMASVAVTRALRQTTGLDVRIKWPNDLLIEGKKVCGILTELRGEQDHIQYVVMGTGINVNVTSDWWPDELKEKATSLAIAGGHTYHRVELIAAILGELEQMYEGYLTHGFEPIRILWEEYAGMLGNVIRAFTPQGEVTGEAIGLDATGALLLQQGDHTLPIFSSDIEV
ncbi:BirA family biotin operon repressor/biotin-[acetyl-CoA-carboxylase] ligase [Desmospora activa DSM 45169]|uniref:Bifunctional ligase/repressor BirA n=1 Tax=Desmospora activa DSM 45169 TaxID=1121389 RepID=A0A2T4ZA36_9BACL|nr:biotin--[acetyl-CoA-carboxylase] ligase [Desmospora activa]PTM58744.1 BirA family biotin operon repressor/biotin-[acetyl-CoA-carboxylase] ligase [Desmospora activa DSM 45169]